LGEPPEKTEIPNLLATLVPWIESVTDHRDSEVTHELRLLEGFVILRSSLIHNM
jgi:hypothetical protein